MREIDFERRYPEGLTFILGKFSNSLAGVRFVVWYDVRNGVRDS